MRFIVLITLLPLLTQAAPLDSVMRTGTIVIGGVALPYRETVSAATEHTKTFELYRDNKKILSHILYD